MDSQNSNQPTSYNDRTKNWLQSYHPRNKRASWIVSDWTCLKTTGFRDSVEKAPLGKPSCTQWPNLSKKHCTYLKQTKDEEGIKASCHCVFLRWKFFRWLPHYTNSTNKPSPPLRLKAMEVWPSDSAKQNFPPVLERKRVQDSKPRSCWDDHGASWFGKKRELFGWYSSVMDGDWMNDK